MLSYIFRRLLYMVLILILVSMIAFIMIDLPPGSYIDTHIAELEARGESVSDSEAETLRRRYGLDRPLPVRYWKWVSGVVRGDLGRSFAHQRPVTEIILERLPTSILVTLATTTFTYLIALPIGIYSAVRQYKPEDYFFTVLGFTGMAIPNFFFAVVLMVFFFEVFGISAVGLFSKEYIAAPWTWGKVWNLIVHLPIPVVVIGTAGAAGLIRVMRGCMLDELEKPYVTSALARGVHPLRMLIKYPLRLALNPILSGVGGLLPRLVSGQVIVGIVLNLPILGPVLFQALKSQDTYLAGGIVMILTSLTVVGIMISDILLAVADPRIRYE